MTEEATAKGIILAAAPQGEYGRRLIVLTDRFGKITVFASGAAKASSKLIGATRPMTAAEFTLMRGRNAWNLRGVRVMDAFEGLRRDVDASFCGLYFMEFAAYFAQEGILETEAKQMLNLLFVALTALSDGGLSAALVRSLFELRMLVIEGEYTDAPGESGPEVRALWRHALSAPLSKLCETAALRAAAASAETGKKEERREADAARTDIPGAVAFSEAVDALCRRQIPHRFKTLAVLQEL